MTKQEIQIEAGRKAAATRKRNQEIAAAAAEATHRKWVEAGKKAYATRLANAKKKKQIEAGQKAAATRKRNQEAARLST